MKFKILSMLISGLAFISIINGQTKKDTLNYQYPDKIIITASRIETPLNEVPYSTSIVDARILEKIPRSISIDEALKLVPGVKVDNQANGSRVHLSMRGQGILTERGIRGIKILLDGIPVNDPTGFAPDFFDVDLGNVDKIEVLRGPAASLYGASASGGIINISTLDGFNRPLGIESYGIGGSNNFWKGGLRLGGLLNNFNYNISISRNSGDGYRDHTHFWGDNIYSKFRYTLFDKLILTPIIYWTKSYHENPEGINISQYNDNPKQSNPDAIPYNEFLKTERLTEALTGKFNINDINKIDFSLYSKKTLFTEANNHTYDYRTITTPGLSVQYSLTSGNENKVNNIASTGVDIQSQNINEYRIANNYGHEYGDKLSDQKIEQKGLGVFILDQITYNKIWGLTLSLRYDKINNELTDNLKTGFDASGKADFNRTTGRIGLTYSPIEELNLFANCGQGFLPPATEELAQNPDHYGGFNSHLTFATSNGIDLGLRGVLNNNLKYDITAFYLKTNNDFDRYRISDLLRNQETFYRNAGASRRFGIELAAEWSPVSNINISAAYTYSNFKYTISNPIKIIMDDTTIIKFIHDGNKLPNSPEHQLALEIQYFPAPVLSLSLNTETISKTYIDGANIESEAANGYTLLNGRIGYFLNIFKLNGELSLTFKNLTSKKYVAFTEPDPGGNSYQPGSGREIFGGIKFIF